MSLWVSVVFLPFQMPLQRVLEFMLCAQVGLRSVFRRSLRFVSEFLQRSFMGLRNPSRMFRRSVRNVFPEFPQRVSMGLLVLTYSRSALSYSRNVS